MNYIVTFKSNLKKKLEEHFLNHSVEEKWAFLCGYLFNQAKSSTFQIYVYDIIKGEEICDEPKEYFKNKYLLGAATTLENRKTFYFHLVKDPDQDFVFFVIKQNAKGLVFDLYIQKSGNDYHFENIIYNFSETPEKYYVQPNLPTKPVDVYFPENIVEKLKQYFVMEPIEQGVFLFGTIYKSGKVVISDVIHDTDGSRSGCSYTVSSTADAVFLNYQKQTNNKQYLVGIAHSHPKFMYFPSISDRYSFFEFLRLNPEYSTIIFPIVCQVPSYEKLGLYQAKICDDWVLNVYVQTKESFDYGIPHFLCTNSGSHLTISSATVDLNPHHQQELSIACNKITENYKWILKERKNKDIEQVPVSSFFFLIKNDVQLELMFLPGYPVTPPTLTVHHETKKVEFLPPLKWDLNINAEDRLISALKHLISQRHK